MAPLAPNNSSSPTKTAGSNASPVPVLLLKTKSSPIDAYEELFASASSVSHSTATTAYDGCPGFEPLFVPVLEHRFDDDGVARLRELLVRREIKSCRHAPTASPKPASTPTGQPYGGVIFTSQRAVEAFASVVKEGEEGKEAQAANNSSGVPDSLVVATEENEDCCSASGASWPHLHNVPVYSVGPATTRALRAVAQDPPLQVHGDHTGNGEDLAHFIREHYTDAHHPSLADKAPRPLLFVVGEKRRDIIPKVLGGNHSRDGEEEANKTQPIPVDELVVYGTGVMASFADDFQRALAATEDRSVRWAVVFSPTGCDSLLASLGLLDPATGRVHGGAVGTSDKRTTFVATIGPTTRAYLQETFGFEPDVCADEPSPAGVLRGITEFMTSRGL